MENLNIIYFLETTTICGGVKVVFEQARELISRNINTKVASFFPYPYWHRTLRNATNILLQIK
jgi:arabinogalactan endo-1,4-beta-galactosidase